MGSRLFAILLIVLIIGGVIYVFNSGLLEKSASGLTNVFHVPSFKSSSSASSTASSNSNANPSSAATSTINPADIPAGFTAAQLSPYFDDVQFDGVSPGNGDIYSGNYGQITLEASFPSNMQPIDVTGWEIKSNRGGEYIPRAINLYDPSGLSQPGDIMLASGQSINLYSFPGPFNLRLNECIGYIAVQDKFTPSLPQNCPSVQVPHPSTFTGACQNFINSIGNCQTPNLNTPQFPQNDYACLDFIQDNFNYQSCFNAHVNDTNFLSNQWWIWMGSNPLDPYHDNVYLYDKSGLLVDIYSY